MLGCWEQEGTRQLLEGALKQWDKRKFRDIPSKISGAQKRLQQLLEECGSGMEVKAVKSELEKLIKKRGGFFAYTMPNKLVNSKR